MIDIKENKKALMASIRKYRRTVKLLEENVGEKIEHVNFYDRFIGKKEIPYGTESCPLCKLYYYYSYDCKGCCIFNDTKIKCCNNTPYNKYDNTLRNSKTVTKTLIKATKNELNYLENLYKRLK